VLVAGATSMVAHYLIPRLVHAGYEVHAVSRRPSAASPVAGVVWHVADVARGVPDAPAGSVLIHLAPLWLAPPLIRALLGRGLRRVIAFGSTSRFTKHHSPDAGERETAARLAAAEAEVERDCQASGVPWTIFRPTLVYGGGLDRNVSTIASFIRRFGFAPVVDRGRALRQPVHADDLAAASLAVLERAPRASRAYDLSGRTLSYRDMVRMVFEGLGRRPVLVNVPVTVARVGLPLVRALPGFRHLGSAMVDRTAQDLCFDHTDAALDLGFAPRPFVFPG